MTPTWYVALQQAMAASPLKYTWTEQLAEVRNFFKFCVSGHGIFCKHFCTTLLYPYSIIPPSHLMTLKLFVQLLFVGGLWMRGLFCGLYDYCTVCTYYYSSWWLLISIKISDHSYFNHMCVLESKCEKMFWLITYMMWLVRRCGGSLLDKLAHYKSWWLITRCSCLL